MVGDHSTYHVPYDAQLQSDIKTVGRNVSSWMRTTGNTAAVAKDAAEPSPPRRARPVRCRR
jgi:acetolactate synthase I/II/III large subunit